MITKSIPRPARRDPMLEARMSGLMRKLRETRLHRRSTVYWATVVGVATVCLGLRYLGGINIGWAAPFVGLLILTAIFRGWLDGRRLPTDIDEAARYLEGQHPDLELALRTALEQRAENGRFNFLQKRVIARALSHASTHDWNPPLPTLVRWRRAHTVTMAAAFCLLIVLVASHRAEPGRRLEAPKLFAPELTVTPGNADLERGSIAVITARFSGSMPIDASLVWQTTGGSPRTEVMAKSLSDPIFAFTLPPLEKEVSYHIQYGEDQSPEYRLAVFTLPALTQADATLRYPAYTRIPERVVRQTRRISAVEGSQLIYEFTANKPLRRAYLQEKDGTTVELAPNNPERTRFQTEFSLRTSRQFQLVLVDEQGRTNNPPDSIRVEALPNKRPEPRIVAPVGDTRVSPIEEVRLEATARDEFGLLDYGVAVAVGEGEPRYISLSEPANPPIEARFQHLLALETHNVSPGQLLTWFAWADDFGPDGQRRRSSGDLQFAEVRPLDEIFREDDSGGGSTMNGQGGEEAMELLELQRQVSIALWNLRQRESAHPEFGPDLRAIEESQQHIREKLGEGTEQLSEPAQRQAVEAANRFMGGVLERIADSQKQDSAGPLTQAWTQSQGAYQELLKLAPQETRVGQANSRSSGRNSRGSQGQLNQLEFKQAENRYETETEAQPLTTPEQREQLQALSRLRELARRQQEMNQRLQELQTALTAAQDEAGREQVRRELKRLEEEQRQLLADTDELRERMERMPPSNQVQQAREELEQTREDMRRSGERLERGEISPALASGTRAAESLEQVREDFRQTASGQFSEQMRQARQAVRELSEQQAETERAVDELAKGGRGSLDDSAAREELAQSLEAQRESRDQVLQQLRQVAEDSEASEPSLHRRLYDVLRQHGQAGTGEQMEAGAEMLRRGFVQQAREAQDGVGRSIQELRRGIERAAESVLGNETAELRYAQSELEELNRQLQKEQDNAAGGASGDTARDDSSRPGLADEETDRLQAGNDGGEDAGLNVAPRRDDANGGVGSGTRADEGRERPRSGGNQEGSLAQDDETTEEAGPGLEGAQGEPGRDRPGSSPRGGRGMADGIQRLLDQLSRGRGSAAGPITGEGFGEWIERLRTVEELMDSPEARQRVASAREQAEALRRDFRRHSREPQWESIESGIATPLAEARVLLRQELARRENPESLQPVDRDPVPDRYSEAVQKYYEALGQ